MLAPPFSAEYSSTISSLGQLQPTHNAQIAARPASRPQQPVSSASPLDELPAHPLVAQLLLHSASSLSPPSLSSLSSPVPSPPSASSFFISADQERPYFLHCLSCSSPLSDVFHVTDGDDAHVTVDAVYSDSVLSAPQPSVLASSGLFYALSCARCGGHVGRYFRFTSPGAINKCNHFSLDVQCVGVRLLGSASVRGEQYAEETGIATRLTQLMLATAAVREDMETVRREAAANRAELDRARSRARRVERRLRQLLGDQYDEEELEEKEGEERQQEQKQAQAQQVEKEAVRGSGKSSELSAQSADLAHTVPPSAGSLSTAASMPASTPAKQQQQQQQQSSSAAKKRGRPSAADRAASGGGAGSEQQAGREEAETAHEPAVKRKAASSKKAALTSVR